MLVYNEIKLYREHQLDCEFAMIKGNYQARVYSPLDGTKSAEEMYGPTRFLQGRREKWDGEKFIDIDPVKNPVYDAEGNYADHLLHEGKSIVISIYDTDIKNKDRNKIQTLIDTAISEGFSPIVLASDYIEPFSDAENYFADYKTLLTLNRSNGGATYIYDSIIIRKWAKKSLPDSEELAMIYNEDVTESIIGDSHRSLAFQGFLLYVFAVMLLL
jgi:hypothetical protein